MNIGRPSRRLFAATLTATLLAVTGVVATARTGRRRRRIEHADGEGRRVHVPDVRQPEAGVGRDRLRQRRRRDPHDGHGGAQEGCHRQAGEDGAAVRGRELGDEARRAATAKCCRRPDCSAPVQTTTNIMELKAGRYGIFCFVPAPDGKSHVEHGMVKVFDSQGLEVVVHAADRRRGRAERSPKRASTLPSTLPRRAR